MKTKTKTKQRKIIIWVEEHLDCCVVDWRPIRQGVKADKGYASVAAALGLKWAIEFDPPTLFPIATDFSFLTLDEINQILSKKADERKIKLKRINASTWHASKKFYSNLILF